MSLCPSYGTLLSVSLIPVRQRSVATVSNDLLVAFDPFPFVSIEGTFKVSVVQELKSERRRSYALLITHNKILRDKYRETISLGSFDCVFISERQIISESISIPKQKFFYLFCLYRHPTI